MNINEDKKITVVDDEGKEHLMEVLFTYEHEERKTSYIYFFDPKEPENVMVMRYNETPSGNVELSEIEDDDEYEECEEVFNTFMEDPKINNDVEKDR